MAMVKLSALVERFSVPRMRDFFLNSLLCNLKKILIIFSSGPDNVWLYKIIKKYILSVVEEQLIKNFLQANPNLDIKFNASIAQYFG